MDSFILPKLTPPALFLLFLTFSSPVSSVFFNYPTFTSDQRHCPEDKGGVGICTLNDSSISPSNGIQLTRNDIDIVLNGSVGRAFYSNPISLYDPNTLQLTDFITHFTFSIKKVNELETFNVDGMTFFLVPFNDSSVPDPSLGGCLGLISNCIPHKESHQVVAVEFDTYLDSWEKDDVVNGSSHVGIDVGSIKSVATVDWQYNTTEGKALHALVSYDSSSMNLSVLLTCTYDDDFCQNLSLSYIIDLRKFLPSEVAVGFSATTRTYIQTHSIKSWDFNSTLKVKTGEGKGNDSNPCTDIRRGEEKGKSFGTGAFASVSIAAGVEFVLIILVVFYGWIRLRKMKRDVEEKFKPKHDGTSDEDFGMGSGPRRFPYAFLAESTNNFSLDGKLGEGGFGGVYKGRLGDANTEVAIKRVSKASRQGKKEFMAEVNIISRLRHRNLVQLIGWCHEQDELLLVYEYMPNGSLDMHLFNPNVTPLSWLVRRKIVLGIASGLMYLHDEWEQCVLHRDVKSSNVMLDSNFNAKLGDFGLAKLVDHERGAQTTALAGTLGYMAPECVVTGRASRESDIYSFGVVVLEIVSGRRAMDNTVAAQRVGLVEWVWSLYDGESTSTEEAIDKRIWEDMDLDLKEVERFIEVGLWCSHPDVEVRPSMKQAIRVLDVGADASTSRKKMSKPVYFSTLSTKLHSSDSRHSTQVRMSELTSSTNSGPHVVSKAGQMLAFPR